MTTTNPNAVIALISQVAELFGRQQVQDDSTRREIQNALALLEKLPPLRGEFVKSSHAIARHAENALKNGNESTAGLIAAIRPVIHFLPWRYNYPKRGDAPNLGERIAFAEIVGPEAPFPSRKVCLGLTLIAPDTLYPEHKHPAVELYYVAAGTAEWTAGAVMQSNPPGTFVLHPSGIVHAMRTGKEPLLAVYTWTGSDVVTTSVYAAPNNSGATQHL